MKFVLLAAAAAIAAPAFAQETPGTATDQTMPAGDPSAMGTPDQSTSMPQSDPSMQTAPAGDPSMQQPSTQTTGGMSGGMMSSDPNAADPAGGYQPSTMSSGPAQPGARVQVQPSMSPNEAFPPPPPMKKYPICKKGQYDNCMQRGGR